jgi:hypothetical protein
MNASLLNPSQKIIIFIENRKVRQLFIQNGQNSKIAECICKPKYLDLEAEILQAI